MSGHKVTDPEVLRRIAALIVLERKHDDHELVVRPPDPGEWEMR